MITVTRPRVQNVAFCLCCVQSLSSHWWPRWRSQPLFDCIDGSSEMAEGFLCSYIFKHSFHVKIGVRHIRSFSFPKPRAGQRQKTSQEETCTPVIIRILLSLWTCFRFQCSKKNSSFLLQLRTKAANIVSMVAFDVFSSLQSRRCWRAWLSLTWSTQILRALKSRPPAGLLLH